VAYDALAMRSEVDTQRLEAFSDGGFALAIALLIIEVGVNEEGSSPTAWPSSGPAKPLSSSASR
jgi:uncharacterized membrane protein